jgi:Holliday junction DNA helicase RuvA
MSVQGIGAKASMSILGALGPDGVSRAISMGDWSAIKAAKGVGPKTAQKVVIELKDKAPGVMALGGTLSSAVEGQVEQVDVIEPSEPAKPSNTSAAAQAEALSALVNLGYAQGDAAGAVMQAMQDEGATDTADVIRTALRLLAPKE